MNKLFILTVVLLGLGACGGGDDAPQAPTVPTVEFKQFVLDEFELTDKNDEPAEVNDITFSFDEDETAFDKVL